MSHSHDARPPRSVPPTDAPSPAPSAARDGAADATVRFSDLDLCTPLLDALRERGYEQPTPIQAQAIPHLLEGRDLLGVAQTGTGKTAAFALPILDYLSEDTRRPKPNCPRSLVLTPTRELASQIADSFEAYGKGLPLRTTVIFGGVGQGKQVNALRRGIDILVATPGRLLDLMGQGHIDLSRVECFVLDEADRMLDMGFLRDVRRVVAELPPKRQSLLFSATMPNDIVRLAKTLLYEPIRVEVTPPSTTVERISQAVIFVPKKGKPALLSNLLRDGRIEQVLVFTRTKHGANRVVKHLDSRGIASAALHGNKSQGARERALAGFREGRLRVLVATDIAARGLDVPGMGHVINYDLPNIPESYVHRIGRTARAGLEGHAISFCDPTEVPYLKAIEREIRQKIDVMRDAPLSDRASFDAPNEHDDRPQRPASGQRSGSGQRSRRPRRPRSAGGQGQGRGQGQRPSQGRSQGQRQGQGSGPSRDAQPRQGEGASRPARTGDAQRKRRRRRGGGQGNSGRRTHA